MAASFLPSASPPPPLDGVYHCGTLTYTRRTLAIVFFWLLWGDFCFVLMESVVPNILPLKFNALGASNQTIGLLLSTIPQILTAIFNPIISFRSDRFRSRFGRRIPFLLFTAPFIVLCLFGIGFADSIATWVGGTFGFLAQHYSPAAIAIGTTGVLLVLFTFFNAVGTSTYWYLFNDVVPEHLLARFMSWFRMVSMGSAVVFNTCILPFADPKSPNYGLHFRAILFGAGTLYLIGFGLMCLKVREGEYPPSRPNLDNSKGLISAIKTYATECHSHWHYWYLFLGTLIGSIAGGAATFMIFFYKNTGLTLLQVGTVLSALQAANAALIVVSGWLADRFHPIRVVIVGSILNVVLVLPLQCVWIFWHPSGTVAFWAWIIFMIGLSAPTAALVGVFDPPLFMRLFPRSNYGQFCSANQIWRSIGGAVGGVATGAYLDWLKRHGQSEAHVYTFIPVWQLLFTIPATFCTVKLYQSWKRYGGDFNYDPPLPGARIILQANVPAPMAIPGTGGLLHGPDMIIEAARINENVEHPSGQTPLE